MLHSGPYFLAEAHPCYVGQERDPNNQWLWVLPYEDPCLCTSLRFGGLNIDTPKRDFDPVYVETPLLSDDLKEIRDYYGIECKGRNAAEHIKYINKVQYKIY